MIFKAYRDDSCCIGLCLKGVGDLFDGYVDLSPEEKEEYLKVEDDYYKWQELLQKRYKKA